MANVSDGFLLALSEVVATLMGFLLLGAFFYIERGRGSLPKELWDKLAPALRAVMRWVLLMYAFALALSLGLVVLSPLSTRVLFLVGGLVLVTSLVDLTHHYRIVKAVVRLPKRESAIQAWLFTAAILIPPWIWVVSSPIGLRWRWLSWLQWSLRSSSRWISCSLRSSRWRCSALFRPGRTRRSTLDAWHAAALH